MTERIVGTRAGQDPIVSGVELAAERLRRYGIDPSGPDLEEVERTSREYVEQNLGRAPDRAVELFCEQLTVAMTMRSHYGEAELSFAEISEYEESARRFLNSFWHDPI